jgi:hypothetical protein
LVGETFELRERGHEIVEVEVATVKDTPRFIGMLISPPNKTEAIARRGLDLVAQKSVTLIIRFFGDLTK